jgi:hypothetical protein
MPVFVRAEGGVRVVFGATPPGTAPLTIAESGGYRVRFPRTGEGVLINTGGGMTGGDRMSLDVAVGPGADAVVTTQAAEKIYRSDGPDTEIAASLDLSRAAASPGCPRNRSCSTAPACAAPSTWPCPPMRRSPSWKVSSLGARPWAKMCMRARFATAGASGATAASSSRRMCISTAPSPPP